MFLRYCEYCGSSYREIVCRRCGRTFEICNCEWGKTICDECLNKEATDGEENTRRPGQRGSPEDQ